MSETPQERHRSPHILTNTEIHLGALVSPGNTPEAIAIMRWAARELARISIDGEVTAWQVPLPPYSADVGMPPIRSQAEQAGQQQRAADMAQTYELTDGELEVALLIGRGMDNAQMRDRLSLSSETIKSRKTRLYAKTGTSSHNDIMRMLGVLPEL